MLFIRVSPEQKKGLDAAAERHDLPTATWAREVLLVAAGCGDLGKTASLVAATKLDGGKP